MCCSHLSQNKPSILPTIPMLDQETSSTSLSHYYEVVVGVDAGARKEIITHIMVPHGNTTAAATLVEPFVHHMCRFSMTKRKTEATTSKTFLQSSSPLLLTYLCCERVFG